MMKISLKNKLRAASAVLICSLALSCSTNDDEHGLVDTGDLKPIASTTVTSLNLAEGESAVIPFTIDRPTTKIAFFLVTIVDGTATQDEDFVAGDENNNADFGDPTNGYIFRVEGNATSFEIPVSTILDLDQTEGTETVKLKITAVGTRTIITETDIIIDLTITDFQYCLWTLETSDTYGDGWQGAHIDLVVDGETTTYAETGPSTVFDVPVKLGASYSFTYVSGGGTGGAPGYENENYFKLTSPNGTVFEEGTMDYSGIPTAGLITSGTSNCN